MSEDLDMEDKLELLGEVDAKIEKIEAAIHDFHLALDMREHAAGAGWAAMLKIQEILDMPWVQGAEQTRRREGK